MGGNEVINPFNVTEVYVQVDGPGSWLALVHPAADAPVTVRATCTRGDRGDALAVHRRPRGRPQAGASSPLSDTVVMQTPRGHLDTQSTLRDLLRHPAFAGFARLILPWDDRAYDEQMRLSRIGSLLPYHSHVDPETVTTALNRMIDDVASGKTVFYRFYSEAQRQQQPARSNTGLFFFRGRPGAPFAVIAPGGGFSYVASVHEGFPYAVAISGQGLQRVRAAGTGRGMAARWPLRIWPLLSPTSFECGDARCRHERLLSVGEFGWREDGRRDRFARRGDVMEAAICQSRQPS